SSPTSGTCPGSRRTSRSSMPSSSSSPRRTRSHGRSATSSTRSSRCTGPSGEGGSNRRATGGDLMCGIFGIVVDRDRPLGDILVDAGRRLSYRGYDSVGCAVIRGDGVIDLRKNAGKIDDVAAELGFAEMAGRRGMVQLRWATFGAPSRVNAQPHLDSDGAM